MNNARNRFWTAAIAAIAVWLAALFLGGEDAAADEGFRAALYAPRGASLSGFAATITWLGDGVVLGAVAVLAALYLFFTRRLRAALLLITVFTGRLLVELQKLIAGRDRPGVDDHLEAVTSMSFPSSHAANSMITYLAIALLVPVAQRNRSLSIAAALILTLLIGWSRIALGVHWPSDVIGGWAFGLLWVAVCIRLASARGEAEPSANAR
jgi:undecaprenyl-diphosphatase